MSEANRNLIREAYEAFAVGDVSAVMARLGDDIRWHVPGRSPLSGDYKGHDGVLDFFGRGQELSAGTLCVDCDELLTDGDRVVVLSTVSAERNGRSWSSPEVHVWRVVDGHAVEFIEFQGDQEAEDAFWMS